MKKTAIRLKDGANESQLFVDMKESKKKENERRKLQEDVEISIGKPALHFVSNNKMLEIKTYGADRVIAPGRIIHSLCENIRLVGCLVSSGALRITELTKQPTSPVTGNHKPA